MLDVETSALSPRYGRVVEVAVVHMTPAGEVTDEWSTLVDPQGPVGATQVHGVAGVDVERAPVFDQVAGDLLVRLAGRVVVAHNASFDLAFLAAELEAAASVPGAGPPLPVLCTLEESRVLLPHLGRRTLDACCAAVGVPRGHAHAALDDARAAAGLLAAMAPRRLPPRWEALLRQAATTSWAGLPAPSGRVLTRAGAVAARARATGYLARWAAAAPAGTLGSGVDAYLDAVDLAVEDRVVTEEETQDLAHAAERLGLTRAQVRAAHRAYLTSLAAAAQSGGHLAPAREADLRAVAKGLRLTRADVDPALGAARAGDAPAAALFARAALPAGTAVAVADGTLRSADDLAERAAAAGLVVVPEGRADVVVVPGPAAGRPAGASAGGPRAGAGPGAGREGVRRVAEPVFLALLARAASPPQETVEVELPAAPRRGRAPAAARGAP